MSANAVCAIEANKSIIVVKHHKLCEANQVIEQHNNRQILDKPFVQWLDFNTLPPDIVIGKKEEEYRVDNIDRQYGIKQKRLIVKHKS